MNYWLYNYMRKDYLYFNIACLIVSVLFMFGILWLWRGAFVNLKNPEVPLGIPTLSRCKIGTGCRDKNISIVKPVNKNFFINNTKPTANLESTEKTEANLPKEINLAVPFTSQAPEENWDEPWQDACEEAAALMLDAYYKNYNLSPLFSRDEIAKMVKWEEERGWGISIEMAKVGDLMTAYLSPKYKVKIVENPTVEMLKKYLASGRPVLAVADGKVLPNPHFRNGGPIYHALIIRGYTGDSFITNDPGTKFGENFVYKYNDLLNAIHDWNGGDVKNGKKTVLIVE